MSKHLSAQQVQYNRKNGAKLQNIVLISKYFATFIVLLIIS